MTQQWLEGHHARKRFGQNFLHDRHWIERIARSIDPKPGDELIEIGPGQAALTREVVSLAGHETAVEIDRDLAAFLRTQFTPEELTLIEADALTLDWKTALPGKRHIVSASFCPFTRRGAHHRPALYAAKGSRRPYDSSAWQ